MPSKPPSIAKKKEVRENALAPQIEGIKLPAVDPTNMPNMIHFFDITG
jgi:hypothetical protein